MTSRLLLFDFDGVIADSIAQFSQSFFATCKKCDLENTFKSSDFLDLFDTNIWQSLALRGLFPEQLDCFLAALRDDLARLMLNVKPFPGVPEVIAQLGQTHPLYIVTSSLSDVVHRFIETHHITGVRDILGAEKVTSKIEKIKTVARQYPDSQVLYIGDTAGDIKEALQAGATPIAVSWGWHTTVKLKNAGAKTIATSPQHLLDLLLMFPNNETLNPKA